MIVALLRLLDMKSHGWFWVLWVVYMGLLLFSPTGLPLGGEPVWQLQPETLVEVQEQSLNFFFVLPLLNRLGIESMVAPVLHPVDEGLFNFAVGWMWLFLPVLWGDRRGEHLPRTVIWSLGMFLTNVFLIPYMALRREISPEPFVQKPKIAKVFAMIGLVVGVVALGWVGLARPEFGDVGDRLAYFFERCGDSRLTIAFLADLLCFWFFQIFLMGDLTAKRSIWQSLRFIPFFGMACWLMSE